MYEFEPEDERALTALTDAVAAVSERLRAKPKPRAALIAIPDAAGRSLMRRALAAFGFRLHEAGDNAEAAASAAGRTFDLIVLSAGPETAHWARRVRALPGLRGAGALLAAGRWDNPDWREEAADAGVDAFADPSAPGALIETMALLLGGFAADGSIGAAELDPIEQDNSGQEGQDSEHRGVEENVHRRP
ncbi:MAG: hypothetical protein AB7P07_05620 [Hyphomonadaceae bacterium]